MVRYNVNKVFEEVSYRFNFYYYLEFNFNGENYVKDFIKIVVSVKIFEVKCWWNVYVQENKVLLVNKFILYYILNVLGVESKKQEFVNILKYNKSYLGIFKVGEIFVKGLYKDLVIVEINLENVKKVDLVN